jgi:hypothetical protein
MRLFAGAVNIGKKDTELAVEIPIRSDAGAFY